MRIPHVHNIWSGYYKTGDTLVLWLKHISLSVGKRSRCTEKLHTAHVYTITYTFHHAVDN